MFSFDLCIDDDDYYQCSLSFKHEIVELSFAPELKHPIIEGEKGDYKQDTINGHCEFSWDGNTMTFATPKSGYVNGGSQSVTLRLNPEQMASFHVTIRKWNAFLAHVEQGNSATSFAYQN